MKNCTGLCSVSVNCVITILFSKPAGQHELENRRNSEFKTRIRHSVTHIVHGRKRWIFWSTQSLTRFSLVSKSLQWRMLIHNVAQKWEYQILGGFLKHVQKTDTILQSDGGNVKYYWQCKYCTKGSFLNPAIGVTQHRIFSISPLILTPDWLNQEFVSTSSRERWKICIAIDTQVQDWEPKEVRSIKGPACTFTGP